MTEMSKIGEDLDQLSQSLGAGRRTPVNLLSSHSFSHLGEACQELEGEEALCRICMEGETGNYRLIHPCRCSGSVKHLHEECLKTWITSHAEDIDQSSCELCKTPYVMEIKTSADCSPKEALNDGMTSCMFTPLLITMLAILILIAYLLLHSYLPKADDEDTRSYTIVLIVACIISAVVVLGLIIKACKNACIVNKVSSWNILSQDFQDEVRGISSPQHQDDSHIQLDQQHLIDDEVLVVPKTVVVRGKRMPTPTLSPCLTPFRSAANSLAYATPKAHSVNVTPVRSRTPSVVPINRPYSAKVRPEVFGNETQVN